MVKKHFVIIIPGLGDEVGTLQKVTSHWKKYGLEPVMHSVGWRDGKNEFLPKLARLIVLIDRLAKDGAIVSLVGTSAGGSAALNAFIERRNVIHGVINVCGRLRTGPEKGFRSFQSKTASSPAFAQSVKLVEANEVNLTTRDRQKIMTVRALFGDELVPADTTILVGAYNATVPTPEHVLSIGAALTLFSKPLIAFLKARTR